MRRHSGGIHLAGDRSSSSQKGSFGLGPRGKTIAVQCLACQCFAILGLILSVP